MNNDIPALWLWISGIFFLLGIIFFGATAAVLYKMLQMAEELKPKVDSLTTKVEALTVKLDRVADRADETLASVKHSVDGFGGRAQGILGSVEPLITGVAGKLEGVTPMIAGAMAAYRIFMTVKARRDQAKAHPGRKALRR